MPLIVARNLKQRLPLHYRSNVDSTVATLIALADDANTKKIDCIHIQGDCYNIEGHCAICNTAE